jgi:hypothetical protein
MEVPIGFPAAARRHLPAGTCPPAPARRHLPAGTCPPAMRAGNDAAASSE